MNEHKFYKNDLIYLYELSTCRYIRLNALNVLQVHGPRFNAPVFQCYPNFTPDINRSSNLPKTFIDLFRRSYIDGSRAVVV